ncbi:MAG: hypothetical protein ACREQI_11095 [Candidatus Binataceae bacterium]
MKPGQKIDRTETLKRAHRGLQALDGFVRRSQLIAQPLGTHAASGDRYSLSVIAAALYPRPNVSAPCDPTEETGASNYVVCNIGKPMPKGFYYSKPSEVDGEKNHIALGYIERDFRHLVDSSLRRLHQECYLTDPSAARLRRH